MSGVEAVQGLVLPKEKPPGHDLEAWLEERTRAGRPVAVLGEEVTGAGLVRVDGQPPVFWGDPSPQDVAAVLLGAVGVPAARDWPEILEVLLAGLREIRAESLDGLPQLVEDVEFRRAESVRLVDPVLRLAWSNEFRGGPIRLGALAECLRVLLRSAPGVRVVPREADPIGPPALCAPLVLPNPILAQALFVTSYASLTRGEPGAALALRVPSEGCLAGDEPLRHAVSRFTGEVVYLVESAAEVKREERDWLRRTGLVLRRPRRLRPPIQQQRRAAERQRAAAVDPVYGELLRETATRQRLEAAWELVRGRRGGGGADGVSIGRFEELRADELRALSREIRERTYRPRPLRRVWIPKANGERRGLGIPAVRDRVAQAAALLTLTPLFEPTFLDCSYGYRPGRNAHQAIALLEGLRDEGLVWVVNADIRKCFDRIPHDLLLARLEASIPDADLIGLLRAWIEVRTAGEPGEGLVPACGIPQGAPISPLLANVYLHPLDVAMTQRGIPWIRYADDTLCVAASREDAELALAELRAFVTGQLRLELKAEKSGIASFEEGFDFLGFRFQGAEKGIAQERRVGYRKKILQLATTAARDRGQQLAKVRETLVGFRSYFRTGEPKTTEELTRLDEWGRKVMTRFLRTRPAELEWIGSLLEPPKSDDPSRYDWYVPSLVPKVEEQRKAEKIPGEAKMPPPAASVEMILAPTGTVLPAAEAMVTTEDAANPEPPPSAEPPAAGTERLENLFLNEGYAKEDLREFLRLGVGQEEPLLSEDGSLFISLHGCALGKVSQQLVVRKARVDVFHVALRDLKQVAVQAVGVVVSSTLLRELTKRGVPLHFLDWRGVPFADVHAPSRESPSILRGQLRAYESAKGVEISREMLTAKGQNQAQLVKLYARYRARTDPVLGHVLDAAVATMERNVAAFAAVDGPSIDAVRGRFLAIEGRIAAAHFRAIAALLGPEWGFTARTRQKEGFDAVNSTLDYLYGLLYTTCHRALAAAGLDLRLGFVHTDGPDGKLSLLYDFVEEFRALGADRPALALLTRGSKITKTRDGRLSIPTRRKLLRAYVRNLSARCRYRGDRRSLAEIIDAQARHLADILEKPGRRCYHGFHYNH
jgi:group II intron reverse transcriptase/maturase/CRISPR-associated endonuclease Cas1